MNKRLTIVFFSLFFLGLFFIVGQTQATSIPEVKVRDESYKAVYVGQSIPDPVQIHAGETVTITYRFKNIGTQIWDSSSKNYVSAYTMEPRYRASIFANTNWIEPRQTGKINGIVKTGQIGELVLEFKAPEKTGHYTEKFWLAADGYSWVKGGYFYVDIDVVPAVTPQSDQGTKGQKIVVEATDYKAKKLLQNVKSISAVGGERVPIILGFQNLGVTTWKKYTLKASQPTALASMQNLSFADEQWQSAQIITQKEKEVPQWGVVRDEFFVRTPAKKGTYTLSFTFVADDTAFDNIDVQIPVTVTEDAPDHYQAPFVNSELNIVEEVLQPRLAVEPRIRVGVWKDPEKGVEFRSVEDSYLIFDGDTQMGILPQGSRASMWVQNGEYHLIAGEQTFVMTNYIRLVPETNIHAVFELPNYNRAVSWKGPRVFNAYRGAMEYRRTEDGISMYVINDLLFEDYVAGIAETSNASPIEYIKALLTAARTYAYYIQQNSSKHDSRYFDVVAHTGDQLYLGYESERIMPRVVEASVATRGYMMTFDTDNNSETQSEVVITPYFANTDIRTRSWTEVWPGANKPWLVSVKAKYDARDGKKLFGHGVGMSARDAAVMADEEKVDFETILKYYYTGVEIERVY